MQVVSHCSSSGHFSNGEAVEHFFFYLFNGHLHIFREMHIHTCTHFSLGFFLLFYCKRVAFQLLYWLLVTITAWRRMVKNKRKGKLTLHQSGQFWNHTGQWYKGRGKKAVLSLLSLSLLPSEVTTQFLKTAGWCEQLSSTISSPIRSSDRAALHWIPSTSTMSDIQELLD